MDIENYRSASTSRHGMDNCVLQCRVGWLRGCGDTRDETREHHGTTSTGQIQAEHGSIVMATCNQQLAAS